MGAEFTLLYGPDDHPKEERKPGAPVRCRLVMKDGSEKRVIGDGSLMIEAIACDGVIYFYRCTSESSPGVFERVYRQIDVLRVKVILCRKEREATGKRCDLPMGHKGSCSWEQEWI